MCVRVCLFVRVASVHCINYHKQTIQSTPSNSHKRILEVVCWERLEVLVNLCPSGSLGGERLLLLLLQII